MPRPTILFALLCCAALTTFSSAQVTATFSNVTVDGTIGRPENSVLQYTFTQDFHWGGEFLANGVLVPGGMRTSIQWPPDVGIQTQFGGSLSSAFGFAEPTPAVSLSDGSITPGRPYVAMNVRPPSLGLRNVARNMNGETLTLRFGQRFDDGLPNDSSLWQSLSLTFLPYTPPSPPVTGRGTFVRDAGTFNVLGDTIRISSRTKQRADGTFNDAAILGLFNPLGELVTRWETTQEGAIMEIPRTMNGDYYIAFGSISSSWGDRFYHQDLDRFTLTGADVFINNIPGNWGGSGGSINEEWTKFTVVPAPASLALFAALPLLARRRRRAPEQGLSHS